MPLPPDYVGTQDDDQLRSIDVVHIQPSILEGQNLIPSLYGKKATVPLNRFGPTNTALPWITGPETIPGTLRVQTGQWQGSPTPEFDFQWMANGVDIPGATSIEWESLPEYTDQTITVEVRGFNYIGQDYALTPGFDISLLEDMDVEDFEFFVVTGLGSQSYTTIVNESEVIITGISSPNRFDMNRSVAYFITGVAADDRYDSNAYNIPVITGLESEGQMTLLNDDGTVVISSDDGTPLVDGVPQSIQLKNSQAEMDTWGWEKFGPITSVDSNVQVFNRAFHGGFNTSPGTGNVPYSYMWQDVPVQDAHIVDIDAGLTFFYAYWYQRCTSEGVPDQGNLYVEFYDVNMTLLGSNPGPGIWASPTNIYFYRETDDIAIPPNTRFIRVYFEYNWQTGTNTDVRVGSIYAFIRKGARVVSRDFGPQFDEWRVRFTLHRDYTGCALSELEFRDAIGGNDLAVGGSPIFGSAGLGVLNADFAFDDLRNTGYWAGELFGTTNDTAWIGYQFPSPVKPREIDITARGQGFGGQVGREFWLEGKNSGDVDWTRVQYYREAVVGGAFADGEQRQFEVADGPFDFYVNQPDYAPFSFGRNIYDVEDFKNRGAFFRADARFNITGLSFHAQSDAAPWDYRLTLARTNLQKSSGWQSSGMITEVLEYVEATSDGTGGWKEHNLVGSYEFEPGDMFLVLFQDIDTTNFHDSNSPEGRCTRITSYNGNPSPQALRGHIYDRITTWADGWWGSGVPQIGWYNPSGWQGGGIGSYWSVDFKGTVF